MEHRFQGSSTQAGKGLKLRLAGVFAALFCLALLASACGGSGESSESSASTSGGSSAEGASVSTLSGKTVGYIQAGPELYYQCQANGVQSQVESLGGKLVVVNSEDNPQKQLANGQDLIAQQVEAIMLQSTDAASGRRVVDLANEAGIPIFLTGVPVPGSDPTAALNVDFVTVGELMGGWIEENRPDAKVGVITGLKGQGPSELTLEGIEKSLPSTVDVVSVQPADWSRQKAGTVAQNMVQANPEIDLLIVFNEDMAVGVDLALKQIDKQIPMVSTNGSEDGIALMKEGTLLATVAQSPSNEGILSVNLVAEALDGETVSSVDYPFQIITPETVSSIEVPFCLES